MGRCLLSLSWDFSAEYSNCFWAIIVATAKIARNAESLFRVIVLLEPIMPTANLFITTGLGSETTPDLNCSTTSFARPNILGHKEDSYMVSSVDGTQFHSATRIQRGFSFGVLSMHISICTTYHPRAVGKPRAMYTSIDD